MWRCTEFLYTYSKKWHHFFSLKTLLRFFNSIPTAVSTHVNCVQLNFIKVLSLSHYLMFQRFLNISRATAMPAVPNICAKACNPMAMTLFLGSKRSIPGNFAYFCTYRRAVATHDLFFWDSVFSYMIYSAWSIEGMRESCNCFAVMPKGWKRNLVHAAATNSIWGCRPWGTQQHTFCSNFKCVF